MKHSHCPHCGANLNGGSIWQTGYDFALKGKHHSQHGVPAFNKEEARRLADDYAKCYGATRTEGQWRREIGIYDMKEDRTVSYMCPDCEGVWDVS